MICTKKIDSIFYRIFEQENMKGSIHNAEHEIKYTASYIYFAEDRTVNEKGECYNGLKPFTNHGEFIVNRNTTQTQIDNACREFTRMLNSAVKCFFKI